MRRWRVLPAFGALVVVLAACSGPVASAHPGAAHPGAAHPGAGYRTSAAARTPAPVTAAPPREVTATLAPFRLPTPVSRPVVLPSGGGLLSVGGLSAAGTTTPVILRIDLPSGRVTTTGRLAEGVHDAGGAVVAGRYLIFGGGSTTVSSSVQDVTPGSAPRLVGRLPTPRADLVVAAGPRGPAYLLGGYDGHTGLAGVLRTTNGTSFTQSASLPLTVRYPAVAVLDGALWLFGGEHGGADTTAIQRVDLGTGAASIVGHLPRALAHAGAFVLDGVVFVAGGRQGQAPTDQVLRLDLATSAVVPAGRLPEPRSDFGVAVRGGTAYLVGGEGPRPLASIVEIRATASGG